ncbi:hypothetical protein D1007_36185 [Hordeum vulgare]|nr:hypothetical protein D1007_36185 [Hordeum vulgare]
MDDPPPNSGDPAVVPATKAKKKKKAQCTKKPRSELTPEEIAKLDAESAKRRNRRAEAKRKDAAAAYAIELAAVEATRQKADAQEKEDIVSKAHALLMMGLCVRRASRLRPSGWRAQARRSSGLHSAPPRRRRPRHCRPISLRQGAKPRSFCRGRRKSA